ncbi:MAG: DUF3108 domain-containing protein [Acidobacteriaceae bacterium]
MKRTALAICAAGLLVLAAYFPARAQSPAFPPPGQKFPIPAKQTLTYAVDWRVFPAGIATFRLNADGTNEHVTATAASIGTVNLLFPVTDRYDSVFDRHSGCSYEYRKQIQEGRRRLTGLMQLDYAHHLQILSEKNLVTGTSKKQTSPIPGCVTDVLSGIFYVATQPLQVGHDLRFPLADGGKVVAVTMKVEGKETVVTPAGTFSSIRVQPTADAGVVKNRGSIWIWYSDDGRHLPVQVRAHLFWGTITMRLSSYSSK